MSDPRSPAQSIAPLSWITRDDVFRVETQRLWLRWSKPADAKALQQIAGQQAVASMTATWPHPLPADEAATRIASARHVNASGGGLILSLVKKRERGTIVGQIGAKVVGHQRCDVGYMIDPLHAGRGLATEAVRGLVDALFLYTATQTIGASVRIINPASKRVLEKSGFEVLRRGLLETRARGAVDVDFMELGRSDWRCQIEHSRFRDRALPPDQRGLARTGTEPCST
jgi:RimJ/RimL family protein N-acetyltransferase